MASHISANILSKFSSVGGSSLRMGNSWNRLFVTFEARVLDNQAFSPDVLVRLLKPLPCRYVKRKQVSISGSDRLSNVVKLARE